MECEGSWDKMQEMMKEKMGGKWEEMKVIEGIHFNQFLRYFLDQFDRRHDRSHGPTEETV